MPTYGTHTPDVKYVPSSLMAYGYKGVKPVPGVPNMYLKDYQDNLWELDVRSIRPAARRIPADPERTPSADQRRRRGSEQL